MIIDDFAIELVQHLQKKNLRIVFAESCTGGLVSATLTGIAGVSQWHCGSAVTYIDDVKTQWLGVKPQTLATATAVSDEVAREMAIGVLNATKAADIAASITGHLGPDAPAGCDGLVFFGFAMRGAVGVHIESGSTHLNASGRRLRQIEAAETLFKFVMEKINFSVSAKK